MSSSTRPALARDQRTLELTKLIETATYFAHRWYGATSVLVTRTGNPETASLQAIMRNSTMVDLWDLDPVLWDDAHWAALRFVPVGGMAVFQPVLHAV